MKRPADTLHMTLLIASMILLGGLALLFAIVPGAVLARMGVSVGDQVPGILRVGSAPLLAEVVAVAIALGSRSRESIRLVTILLVIHFTAETALRTVNFGGRCQRHVADGRAAGDPGSGAGDGAGEGFIGRYPGRRPRSIRRWLALGTYLVGTAPLGRASRA